MIKKGVTISFFILLMFSLVIAQNNSNQTLNQSSQNSGTGTVIDQAYQCLRNQIENKEQSALSLQEAIFGVLALGGNSKLTGAIEDKKSGSSWSETNTIKDTSQVLLAYDRINRNTEDIESFILSKEISSQDLTWYLQLDIPNIQASSCTIDYASEQRTVTVNEDQTLTGNSGSCLSISSSGYWLRVNNDCIDETFSVSCDQDFVTSLLYQRGGSSTYFVSPTSHSAAALGTTQESINSKCFSEISSCNYEGTLWAALALDTAGIDVSAYLPYLQALSESNVRYLPSAFLHKLLSGSNQYSQLVGLQQNEKFWNAPNSPYNRFYDSSLAMLSLQGSGSIEFSNSQSYFESIVTPEGCWNSNNIRDTGFLLYSGWPRSVSTGTTPPGPNSQSCVSQGYTCTSFTTCSGLGGTVLSNSCNSGVCCSEAPILQTCSEQSGTLCTSGETCSGTTPPSSESGTCCLGSCTALPTANECQTEGGSCYPSCKSDEEQLSFSCDGSDICCIQKDTTTSSNSSLTLWIVILSILILLIILAIVFRNKIKLMLFKRKSKSPDFTRGAPPGGRPPFPPSGPVPLRRPRMIPQQQRRPIARSNQDKEMEETMRKLKEMGK